MVPFDEESVREYIDNNIVAHDAERQLAAHFKHEDTVKALEYHIKAFQSMRKALFGEELVLKHTEF